VPALDSSEFAHLPELDDAQSQHWWQQFNDEKLNQLITSTLKPNFDLAAARANIDAAQAVFQDAGNDSSAQRGIIYFASKPTTNLARH
jgi:outer membrane protein TolC